MEGFKYINIVYIALFTSSLVLIFFAVKEKLKIDELFKTGFITTGKVIDILEKSDSDGTTYKPVFEYKNQYDRIVSFERGYYSKPMNLDIGDTIKIIYAQDGKFQKVYSFWGIYLKFIVLLSIAFPMLLIGGGYLFYEYGSGF